MSLTFSYFNTQCPDTLGRCLPGAVFTTEDEINNTSNPNGIYKSLIGQLNLTPTKLTDSTNYVADIETDNISSNTEGTRVTFDGSLLTGCTEIELSVKGDCSHLTIVKLPDGLNELSVRTNGGEVTITDLTTDNKFVLGRLYLYDCEVCELSSLNVENFFYNSDKPSEITIKDCDLRYTQDRMFISPKLTIKLENSNIEVDDDDYCMVELNTDGQEIQITADDSTLILTDTFILQSTSVSNAKVHYEGPAIKDTGIKATPVIKTISSFSNFTYGKIEINIISSPVQDIYYNIGINISKIYSSYIKVKMNPNNIIRSMVTSGRISLDTTTVTGIFIDSISIESTYIDIDCVATSSPPVTFVMMTVTDLINSYIGIANYQTMTSSSSYPKALTQEQTTISWTAGDNYPAIVARHIRDCTTDETVAITVVFGNIGGTYATNWACINHRGKMFKDTRLINSFVTNCVLGSLTNAMNCTHNKASIYQDCYHSNSQNASYAVSDTLEGGFNLIR